MESLVAQGAMPSVGRRRAPLDVAGGRMARKFNVSIVASGPRRAGVVLGADGRHAVGRFHDAEVDVPGYGGPRLSRFALSLFFSPIAIYRKLLSWYPSFSCTPNNFRDVDLRVIGGTSRYSPAASNAQCLSSGRSSPDPTSWHNESDARRRHGEEARVLVGGLELQPIACARGQHHSSCCTTLN